VAQTVRSRRGLLGATAVVGTAFGLATGIEGATAGGRQCKRRLKWMTNDVQAMGQDILDLKAMASRLSEIPGLHTPGEDLLSIDSELESKRTRALSR
jgi:hypothetical protein